MQLIWKSTFTGNETRIFRGKVLAGLLKISNWKDNAYGELDGHMLRFRTRGFWKRHTQILSIEGERELGRIEYEMWKGCASIAYQDSVYRWKFGSWRRHKWSVTDSEVAAHFNKTGFWKNEGEIEYDHIPPSIILIGLFVSAYFQRVSASN
jgi:hypothetical protein